MPGRPKLVLENLSMVFESDGKPFTALSPVDLDIPSGKFISLIGPSGCGKSTIFNIVAGLQPPSQGESSIDGVDATGTIGRVGYMLQKDLLLPWRTVLDNVILGMEIHGVPLRKRARARCRCSGAMDSPASSMPIPLRCRAACASARRCCGRCCSTPT